VRVKTIALLLTAAFAVTPLDSLAAQRPRVANRNAAACRCDPSGKPRRPRLLLPVAGAIGFLPVALAARDSQPPTVGFPTLVDIRDTSPKNAADGQRQLALGALAPDTATSLPTLMLIAATLTLMGVYLVAPRRRRQRAWWRRGTRGGRWRIRSVYRRRIGMAVAASGGILLLLGSREYAEGAEAQRRARAEWFSRTVVGDGSAAMDIGTSAGSASTDRSESAIRLPGSTSEARAAVRGAPVARLVIPSIDLDEIVVEGVGPIELNAGPGHFPGSVLPGETGNAIVSAHRDRHFRRMDEVDIGTRIRTETRAGATEWVVTERRIVSRDTPALYRESDATLTLTTCWPLRYFGPAPDRLILVAKPAV
jgi:sortase A